MPDINDPQIVRFANEKARVFADAMETAYETAKRFQGEWAALGRAPADAAGDPVIDGAASDGRKPLTGARLNRLKDLADAVVAWFEGGTPPRINVVRAASVNGQARF